MDEGTMQLGWAAVLGLALVGAARDATSRPATDAASRTFDVRAMGAVGDGKALDSPSIQKAIDAAGDAGGGIVVLPAGTYLSGPIRLRSNVTLRLEKDAVLQASPDRALFGPVKSRWEGGEATYASPLVVADGCSDVNLIGPGTIAATERAMLVKDGRNIRFDGITFTNKLRWTLHLLYCDGVIVENCRFSTSGSNTDGIDPDSTRNLLIRKCHFSTGDDCIAIKSGVNAEGVKVGRPSENIRIEDCVMERGHGAVSIGSEMSGGVRNITIARCKMSGCWAGVRIKTRKGRGSYVQDVRVSDCQIDKNGAAILVDTQYRWTAGRDPIPGPEGIPLLRNFSFANITGQDNKAAVSLVGMVERPIEGMTLTDIKLTGGPAGRISNATGVVIERLSVEGSLALTNVKGTGLPATSATTKAGR